jgi:hypothetical protein
MSKAFKSWKRNKKILKIKYNMKTKLSFIALIIGISLLYTYESFSQTCTVSGTELLTNGGFETGSYSSFTSPIVGGCKDVLSDASANGAGCGYSDFQTSANTRHSGTYAFIYDGGSNAGNLLCQTINIDKAKTYDISAYYKSAADPSVGIGNIANLRLTVTIGGVTTAIGSGWSSIANQTSYSKNECYYKAGGSGTVAATICIEFQPTESSPGANDFGQGNDALIDDFSVQEIPSPAAGCTAGTCTYPTTTPVKLISFIAKRSGDHDASLQWTSVAEENFSYYSEIAQVTAKVSSNDLFNYEYYDAYFDQSCYYRLRMVDLDGKSKFSTVISLQKENDYAWLVYTDDEIKIRAVVKQASRWNIACYSLLGQEYVNENVPLSKGANDVQLKNIIPNDNNSKILRITDDDGNVILSQVIFR